MCNAIAPTMSVPTGPVPAAAPVAAAAPVPQILQPTTSTAGVSGGGPSPDLAAALEQLWGAIGALKGAIEGAQGVSGGGAPAASGCGCACHQAAAGVAQVGAPGQAPPTQAPPAQEPPTPAAPQPQQAAGDYKAPKGTKIINPLPGARISSHYGEVAAVRGNRPHSGTDLATGAGTPIKAAAMGRVIGTGFEASGLGNWVEIDHGNGWTTKYGHMLEKPSVKKGDTIKAGDTIGKVGSTGNSTGPHLHFMVIKDGTNQDPAPFLKGAKTF